MAECLQCSAGSHRLLSCPSLNAVCKDCVLGLNYMPERNTQTACFPCRRECDRRGEVIVSACNRTQDSLCECKSGSYLQSPGDIACQRHESCKPGQGVTIAGTPTSNSECGKCEVGTFSSHRSSIQRCRPHTDCDRMGGLKRAGNSTADNLCYNSFSSAFSGLPAYGFPIIICFGVIFLLILIAIIGYCICKRLDRWSRYKHILLHGPKSKRREKSNDLGDIANDEEKEGSVFDQLTTSSANICVGSSSKTLNANSPSSFHDKTGVKDFSDFLEQSIEQGAPHPDNASVNSGIAFNNNGNNNTNLRVEPSAPPPDDLSPSSSEDNNGAG